jgi:hypothetical protein
MACMMPTVLQPGGWRVPAALRSGVWPRLGVKKIPLVNSTQSTWSRPGQSSWATGPCVRVDKAHVPKHKLRTGPWVVLTGDGPLCMGGCGVREVFLACVRRLLNIKPWERSFPYRSSFFYMACMTSEIFFSVFWFAALLSHIKLTLMMCSLSHWQQSKHATYAGWMFYRVPFSCLSYFHILNHFRTLWVVLDMQCAC